MEFFEDLFQYIIYDVFLASPNFFYLIMVVLPIFLFPWLVKKWQRIYIFIPIPIYFFLAIISELNWEVKFALTIFIPIFYGVLWSHVHMTLFSPGALFDEST